MMRARMLPATVTVIIAHFDNGAIVEGAYRSDDDARRALLNGSARARMREKLASIGGDTGAWFTLDIGSIPLH